MSSLPPDPWQILGLAKSADKSEIRSAYRKLVLKCHPDKVQDPTLKAQKQDEFQKVQQAYELLNDDNERAKYEEQVKIHELRKKMASKAMPNTSASRTPPMKHYAFEVRTPPETRYKPSPQPAPAHTKIYTQYATHTRSQEDAPRAYEVYEAAPRSARRAASTEYPKSSRRDREDDRRDRDRDDRRRRKEEEERERERERERLARREAKKRSEKERKLATEEKTRRHRDPYVEKFPEDVEEVYLAKPEKKKSSSSTKKHEEPRERERSTRRGERGESPKLEPRKQKTNEYIEYAANYIERSKAKLNQPSSYQDTYTKFAPIVPEPPAMEGYDESVHRSAARAATSRRMSNDSPKKEKPTSRRQASKEDFDVADATPSRPPPLSKAHTTPLAHMTSSSPPRPSRSNTESYSRPAPNPPAFSRSNTWAVGEDDRAGRNTYPVSYDYGSEDDHPRRSHRSRRSPEAVRYKVGDDNKTSKIDGNYSYGESPSSRRHGSGLGRSPPAAYGETPYKVKVAPSYDVDDVSFANVAHNTTSSYAYRGADLSAY